MDYEWFEPNTVWLTRPVWQEVSPPWQLMFFNFCISTTQREKSEELEVEHLFNNGKADIDVCWNSRGDPCKMVTKWANSGANRNLFSFLEWVISGRSLWGKRVVTTAPASVLGESFSLKISTSHITTWTVASFDFYFSQNKFFISFIKVFISLITTTCRLNWFFKESRKL